MTNNPLKTFIFACGCAPCRSLTALIEDAGARLLISPKNTGRMCEFAVIAAAGTGGLTEHEVVQGRRAYAEHLGVQLTGPTQNASTAAHITWSLQPPGPGDLPRVPLGRARPSKRGDRFFLLLDGAPIGSADAPRPRELRDCDATGAELVNGIEIAWEAGIEQVLLDLDKLSVETEVSETAQYIDNPAPSSRSVYRYETRSSVSERDDDAFEVRIYYLHEDNPHIDADDSWWGHTSMVVRREDEAGSVKWNDDKDPARGGVFTFRKAQWHLRPDDYSARNREEEEIEGRTDLSRTEKNQQIKARRGQGVFRTRVLKCEPSCRLTGVKDPGHLKASHIQPWAESNDADRLNGNNGLMLAPHVDHLFDRADISFENDGTLLVLNEEIRSLLKCWGIKTDNSSARVRAFREAQWGFLETHREKFRARQGKDCLIMAADE